MDRSSLSIRSSKGCWTCRLRKKKCDEKQPGCNRCASVDVECFYGEKPNWIKDTELGKTELERVKKIVAVAASRKRAEFRARSRLSSSSQAATSQQQSGSRATPEEDHPICEPTHSRTEELDLSSNATWSLRWNSQEEANLIMHYLDHVFYVQFRFYTPSISEGSRGWFLALLTRTKPLYHAALSLSAFHQQSIIADKNTDKAEYLHQLGHQHNLTLQELQVFIKAESQSKSLDSKLERNVQILACIVLLISFELFSGGTSNWPVHLRAAADIVLTLHDLQQPQSPSLEYAPDLHTSSPERKALKFFSACVIWYDSLSCVSLGHPSKLTPHYKRLLLGPTPDLGHNIQMHTINGCQNWAAILIGDIAILAAQEHNENGARTMESSANILNTIQRLDADLRTRYEQVKDELEACREPHNRCPPHWMREEYSRHLVLVVTCVFASAAAIYLELLRDPHRTSVLQDTLKEVIKMLDYVPEPSIYRVLVWPICVAGCMASTAVEQDFFREKLMSAISDSKSFGNSSIALQLLEHSWHLQVEKKDPIDCTTTIKRFYEDAGILLV